MANVNGRQTIRKGDHTLIEQPGYPVAAAKVVWGGCMVALDAAGNLVDGGDGTAVKVIGVASETVDNTGGAAGAKRAEVRRGAFWFDLSGTNTPVQASAYLTNLKASDNHTLVLTAGTGVAISGRFLFPGAAGGDFAGQGLMEFF